MKTRSSTIVLFPLKTILAAACALVGLSASSLWAAESVYFSVLKTGGSVLRTGLNENSSGFATSTAHTTASGAIGASSRYKGTTSASSAKDTITWPSANDGDSSLPPTIPYGVYTLKHSKGSSSTDNTTTTYTISADSNCRYQSDGKVANAFGNGNTGLGAWQQLGVLVLDSSPHAPVFSVTFTIPAESGKRLTVDNFQLSSIGEAVHIAVQPATAASLATGASGTICTVSAGGTTSPTYTWKRNGTAISGGAYASYYSGYSSATLSAVNIPASESGVSLTCTVGGTYPQSDGTSSVTSGGCLLTVGSADPCQSVAAVGGITKSPLAPAGQVYSDATTITCTGCSGSATTVKILDVSNGNTVVGTATGGSSTVGVTVSGTLTTGHILCALQTVGGQDSCVTGAPTITVGNSGCTYVAAVGGVATADPITAGDTSVTVTGVSASAQDVTVYANGVQVGQNAAPGGSTTVVVPTSPLVKGQYLTASQKLSGTEGCPPGSAGAPIVGGGNAALTVCLELTVGSTPYLWLGASGRIGGYASPPAGATVVAPGAGWQTISWTPATAAGYNWGTAATYTWPSSGSATLQYIWLCPNDNNEMGPYTVYIDTVQNGSTSLYNWEGDTVGNSAFMQQPSYASIGSGRTPIHDNPNTTFCVNTNADMGAECQRMDWEFVNTASANSMRGVLKSAITVDLSKPISFRILVLPAGSTAPALTLSQPTAKTFTAGTPGSVSITATDNSGGTSTITYQWKKNGTVIDSSNAGGLTGYTTATLDFTSPTMSDAGNYSCAVTDTVTGFNAGTYYKECAQFAVTIIKANQTIAFAPPAAKTYGDAPFDVSYFAATASSGLPVSYASSDPAVASISGSTVTILKAGSTTITASQPGNGDYNPATPVTQTLTIHQVTAIPNVASFPNPSCFGSAVNLTATVVGPGPTGTVQFYDGATPLGSPVPLSGGNATLTTAALATGTHAISAVYSGDVNFTTGTGSLAGGQIVNALPICSINGAGEVCFDSVGNNYAAPAGMSTYAWSISGNGTIPGAAGDQSVSVSAGAAGTFTLHLVITDSNGCQSSCDKTVSVVGAPVITTDLTNLTVCVGAPAELYAAAAGLNLVWQWQLSTDNGANWADITTDATYSSYTNAATVGGDNGNQYRVVVTGCSQSVTSTAAILSVSPTSVGGTATAASPTIYAGNSTTISLSGQTGFIVKWQSSTDGGQSWTDITSTENPLSTGNLTATTEFRAVVQSGVCSSANSSGATVTVLVPPIANDDSLSGYMNQPLTFSVSKLLANDTDPYGFYPLSVASVNPTLSTLGTVALNGSSVTYTPPAWYFGMDDFTYTISNTHGGTATAQVQVFVSDGLPPVSVHVSIAQTAPQVFKISFAGVPGQKYDIQRSTDMVNWTTLATRSATLLNRVIQYEDTNPPSPAFYRVESQ